MSKRLLVAFCLVVALAAPTAWAVTVEGPTVSVIAVGLNPCRQHPNHRCRVNLYPEPVNVMPAGGSAWFQGVMGAQYPAWTVGNGGGLNGKFIINTYDAYNDCNPGGAEFDVSYQAGAGDPADVIWAQGIFTNHRRGGRAGVPASYMDVIVDADPATWDPPAYPYQYTDSSFYDKPGRPCPAGGYIYWIGEAYATAIDYVNQVLTVYEGLEWGFEYRCWKLEPCTVAPTYGSPGTVVTYDPSIGQLNIFSPAVTIMNLTGGNEFDPMFGTDPLQGCSIQMQGLHWAGQDLTGGYAFTHGHMIVMDPFGRPALVAGLSGVYVDDTMMPGSGFNIVGIYDDIDPLNEVGSQFMQMYTGMLDADAIPQFTMATVGPFSTLLGEGNDFVQGQGTLKHGFGGPEAPFYAPGDMNCDGLVNAGDIPAFIQGLTEPATYAINHPDCPMEQVGDCNGDGFFNAGDIPFFVDILIGG